jgi:hypothetical protein
LGKTHRYRRVGRIASGKVINFGGGSRELHQVFAAILAKRLRRRCITHRETLSGRSNLRFRRAFDVRESSCAG